jgi:PAS domain S-box-containing protein
MSNPRPKNTKSKTRFAETGTRNNILEELPIGICHSDLKGTIKYVNKYFEKVTGYTRDEIIGRNTLKLDFFPDNMLSYILKRIAARIGGAPSKKWDTQFKCKDGTWIWVTLEGTIIRKSGVPVGFQIVASNISERKRAEEALLASETRYKELFNNISSGVAIYKATDDGNDFVFQDFNKAGEKLGGDRKEDIVGRSVLEVRPGIKEFGLFDVLKRVWATGIPEHFPVTYYKDNRISGWYDNYVYKLPTGEIVAVYDNVTEQKKAEEALRETEEIFNQFMAASPELVYIKDENHRFYKLSKSFEDLFNKPTSELIGRDLYDLLPPDLTKIVYEDDQKVLREGVKVQAEEKMGDVYFSSIKFPIHRGSGKPDYLGGYSINITKRKRAEAALKESEAKYRLMVESSRDAIVISQNDRFIFINDAFADILGYQKEDLLLRNYQEVYTEKAVDLIKERDNRRSRGEIVEDRYETVFRKKDGSEIPVEANVRIIDYQGQKATFAVLRDISKQKEIIAALQETAEQSEHLKNLIPICAGCNKIRDDDQESHPWVSPAVYINDRLPDINFSHSMCPDCMQKWYPDYVSKKDAKDPVPQNG